MNALEQSFADIAAANNLTVFTVGYRRHPVSDLYRWDATAHFDDAAPGQLGCASECGPTIADAITNTLAKVAARRGVPSIVIVDKGLLDEAA